MNEVEYMLMQDNREKKSAGRGIYHKRSGSKTKYCGLPSDHLTHAQWKRRNGPVQTYNINRVISNLEDFKALPVDMAAKYLSTIQDTYNVSVAQVAESMGVTSKRLKNYCCVNKIPYRDRRGRRILNELWPEFLAGNATSKGELINPIPAPVIVDTPDPVTPDTPEVPDIKTTPSMLSFRATDTPSKLLDLITLAFADMAMPDAVYEINLMLNKKGGDD